MGCVTEYWPRSRRSLNLDAGELDHLGPLLGFVSDELSEFGRRHRHGHAPKVGEPRLKLGVGEDGVDLSVELLDDLISCGMVLTGSDRFTETMLGTRMMPATGAMSRMKLNLRFSKSVALLAFAVVTYRSV